jgi:hypothetical protein
MRSAEPDVRGTKGEFGNKEKRIFDGAETTNNEKYLHHKREVKPGYNKSKITSISEKKRGETS